MILHSFFETVKLPLFQRQAHTGVCLQGWGQGSMEQPLTRAEPASNSVVISPAPPCADTGIRAQESNPFLAWMVLDR